MSMSRLMSDPQKRRRRSQQSPDVASKRPDPIAVSRWSSKPFRSRTGLLREVDSIRSRPMRQSIDIEAALQHAHEQVVPANFLDELNERNPLQPTYFAWDPATNGALVAQRNIDHDCFLTSFCFWTPRSRHLPLYPIVPELLITHNHGLRPPGAFASPITSISISRPRVAAITTRGGARNSNLTLMMLSDPELHEAHPPEFDVAVVYNQPTGSLFCSAAAPRASESVFAVGTDSSVMLFQDHSPPWHNTQSIRTKGAVHSVEWIDPNVVAAGQNNGQVVLWDVRGSGRNSHALRLMHPTMVDNMRVADRNGVQLVVSGPSGATAMYDLRMPHTLRGGWRHLEGDRAFRQSGLRECHSPVVRFAHRAGLHKCGLDVHPGLGLLAAGTAEGSLGIYSLSDGRLLKESRSLVKKYANGSLRPAGSPAPLIHEVEWVDVLGEDVLLWTQDSTIRSLSWPREGLDVDAGDNDGDSTDASSRNDSDGGE